MSREEGVLSAIPGGARSLVCIIEYLGTRAKRLASGSTLVPVDDASIEVSFRRDGAARTGCGPLKDGITAETLGVRMPDVAPIDAP